MQTPWSSPDEIVVLLVSGLIGAFSGSTLKAAYDGSEDHKDVAFVCMIGVILVMLTYACLVRWKRSPRTPATPA
jgi:uncharacterized membrane protein YeaQ/YmgE (transglycosylase-associated protein family)